MKRKITANTLMPHSKYYILRRHLFCVGSVLALSSFIVCCETPDRPHQRVKDQPMASEDIANERTTPPESSIKSSPAGNLPDFTFFNPRNGFSFKRDDLNHTDRHVFILFDPGCGHCQTETVAIANNFEKFKQTSFYFVSMQEPSMITEFSKTYAKGLEEQENVKFLFDRNMEFIKNFHIPTEFPAGYVYETDGSFLSAWEGEKDINDIINQVNR